MADDAAPAVPSGRARLLALLAGARPPSGLMALLDLRLVAVEEGRVALAAAPGPEHYNFGGSVHGGYSATVLDTAMGCAAQSVLADGLGITTLELKIAYHRAITRETGPLRAEGRVKSAGRRVVFAEADLTDATGRLMVSGSSTLLVMTP